MLEYAETQDKSYGWSFTNGEKKLDDLKDIFFVLLFLSFQGNGKSKWKNQGVQACVRRLKMF